MNEQNNPFNFNRDPKPQGNSISDFVKNTSNVNNNPTQKKEAIQDPRQQNLNSINSQKMNENNIKKDTVSFNMPVAGSPNTDGNPINPGMIKTEANRQNHMNDTFTPKEQPTFSKAIIGNMQSSSENSNEDGNKKEEIMVEQNLPKENIQEKSVQEPTLNEKSKNEESSLKDEKSELKPFMEEGQKAESALENVIKEEIKPLDINETGYHNPDDIPKSKRNLKRIIMIIILIGIIVEVIVLVAGIIIKRTKVTVVTCTNSNQYEYYKANIKQTRKYSLKQNKIVKLEETIDYVFYDSAEYLEYKGSHMNPPYADIKGRSVMTSINDDTLTYTEKIIYDYNSLLANNKNTSQNAEYIVIETGKKDDTITLVNSDATGIKTYHSDTFTCK